MLYDPKWEVTAPTPAKDEPWRQILRDAANLIERRGWTQHKLKDHQGRMCAVGAIQIACGYDVPPGSAHYSGLPKTYYGKLYNTGGDTPLQKMYHYIREQHGRGIPSWNDDPNRTKEEVIDALRHVAEMD